MEHKNNLYIAAAILFIAIAGWLLYPAIVRDDGGPAPTVRATMSPTPAPTASQTARIDPTIPVEKTHIRVGIYGNVMFPGEYFVRQGETLADLIERAGGFTDGADVENLPLEKLLYDGEYIEIP